MMFTLLTLTCLLAATWSCNAIEESPTWPVKCGFHKYIGYPAASSYDEVMKWSERAAPYYDEVTKWSERGCRELCKSDRKCGMYSWAPNSCSFFQHSVKMHEKMGRTQEEIFRTDWRTQFKSGSRSCEAEPSVAGECDEYPVYKDRLIPPAADYFTRIRSNGAGNGSDEFTATMCQNYCTLYSRCTSVRYWIAAFEWRGATHEETYCDLYDVSIVEGGDYGLCIGSKSVLPVCGTYMRYCREDPYDPLFYAPPPPQ